jgi:SAM-dependent methyltransferase
MLALDVVGSDVDHFGCPHCGAHDRERHLFLYMRESGLLARVGGGHVLHFAPEQGLSVRIRNAPPSRYVKCDLFPASDEILKVDMLDIPFADETFDFVIASHVLEHVSDDRRAVSEIRRVLKVGGHAILQTPYSRTLVHTWEDPGITTREGRIEAYGQDDHVRLFARDIFERITSSGLESRVASHDTLLAKFDPDVFGVNREEPFFLFRRTH